VPYVIPFGLFIAVTAAQGIAPDAVKGLYPAKTFLVALLLVVLLPWIPSLKPTYSAQSVSVGLLVCVIWVAIDGFYPHLSTPQTFDPTTEMGGVTLLAWVAVRLFGAAVVVAVMEELFWRGFLLRWIIKQDFLSVSLGTLTWTSFTVTSVLFAVEHNRWLAGLLAGVIYNLWLYRTRSLYACIVAHGVTNLALGVYVLIFRDWAFW